MIDTFQYLLKQISKAYEEENPDWTDAVGLTAKQAEALITIIESLANAHDCLVRHKHEIEDRAYVADVIDRADSALRGVGY